MVSTAAFGAGLGNLLVPPVVNTLFLKTSVFRAPVFCLLVSDGCESII
jgi:hypothetical protein